MAEAAKAGSVAPAALPTWPDEIYKVLKDACVRQVAMVPDAGHSRLIRSFEADPETRVVTLTTEEEGVAILAGAWMGGDRGVLLMQSSGVGNCINTFSILKNCAIPCVLVVSMRGEFNDFNSWQVPMGSITEPVLKLCGFQVYRVEQENDVEPVTDAACKMAFGGGNVQVAILLSQRMTDRTKPKGH